MKKKIIFYVLFALVILILLDSTKIKSKYVNKFFLEVNPKYLSASIFKKTYKYLNEEYEVYLTKYSNKHSQYWNLENPKDRTGLKTNYTVDKTNDFTKNDNLNPINAKDWPRSHGNNYSNRFSDLSLVNKKNISSLEVAWIYHSNSKKGAGSDIQCNPIIVNGIIYSPVVGGFIAAIDGYSGKEIWKSKKLGRDVARRGIVYWEGNDKSDAKILFNETKKYLCKLL